MSTGILFGSAVFLLISYYLQFLVGFYVGNILWGLAVRLSIIPILDVITRHTYPKDEAVVTVWLTGSGSAILILMSGVARLLTENTAPESALIFMVVIMFFEFLLSFFLKPHIRRRESSQEPKIETQNQSESLPLIQSL